MNSPFDLLPEKRRKERVNWTQSADIRIINIFL